METRQGKGRGAQAPEPGFGPTTTAAEVISGVRLDRKVAIISRRKCV